VDPVKDWENLNRRIRLSYYIGQPAVDRIDAHIRGKNKPTEIGIDVDNDGTVDTKVKLSRSTKSALKK